MSNIPTLSVPENAPDHVRLGVAGITGLAIMHQAVLKGTEAGVALQHAATAIMVLYGQGDSTSAEWIRSSFRPAP